jgi:uncharacterized damage-inducible protein DinB
MTTPPVPDPIEPSFAAGERETLIEFLDWYRTVLLRKGDGLTPHQLSTRLGPSSLTIGRLIRHMTFVEDFWFDFRFAGNPEREPWASAPWDADHDWEMTTADGLTFTELRVEYDAACARSRVVVDESPDLDPIAAAPQPDRQVSLRWILVHMIEEYARHCGHADFLREAIDGRTGD